VTTVGAALVLLKRGKDIFWILAGFALLGSAAARARRCSAPPRSALVSRAGSWLTATGCVSSRGPTSTG
jgi:hypothetical protein